MIQPISFERDDLIIHPLRSGDLTGYEELAKDIFRLLSDEETLRFIPEKRLASVTDAQLWLDGALINLFCGRNSVHLIRSLKTGRVIGVIDIIPPSVAREHYLLNHYPFFIEFYLMAGVQGKAVMSRLLPEVIGALRAQGIRDVAAVVNRKNIAASRVLDKSGFICRTAFDPVQDFYVLGKPVPSVSYLMAAC